jgi:flagellar assembly protein FliH
MAGIIKAAGCEESTPINSARAFHFDDMGQRYVGRVRSEASQIISDARREAEKMKAKALEEGKQAALAAVEATLKNRLEQQLGSVLASMQQAVQGVLQSRQAWERHWEEEAVKLAAAISQRIIRRELQRQPQITLDWVREALQLAAGSGQVILRLNPQDHAALSGRIDRLVEEINRLGPVRVVADPAISPGGCKVETEFGSLDQQIEAQLARISEELLS